MENFNKIIDDLKDQSSELIKISMKKWKDEAKKDVDDFLDNSKDKLERWTKLLASGKLSPDEYEFLLESQKDLLVMNSLKQKGLSKIRLDQFKNSILNLIIDLVFDKLL